MAASKARTALLNIVIAGEDRSAQAAIKRVEVSSAGLGGKLKGLAVAAGGFMATGAIVRYGQQAVNTYRTVGMEMLKLQRTTGMAEKSVSGLWVAAQQSGVPIQKLQQGLNIFSSAIVSGKAKKLGLDLKDATGKALPLDQALRKVADRVSKMPAGAERNNLVRQLFGRGGDALLPLLLKGGDALDAFTAKAKQLGLELNAADIKAAVQNQRDFQLSLTAAGFVIGKDVLPAVTAFMGVVSRNMPPIVHLFDTLGGVFRSLPGPLKALAAGALLLGPAAKGVTMLLTPLKMTLGVLSAGKQALGMFQLGLAGLTDKGAGAANALGGLIATIGPAGVAGGVAGLGLISAALVQMQVDAQRFKADVSDLQRQIETGMSSSDAAIAKLSNTLAGVDGGFSGLAGSHSQFAKQLREVGLSATDAARAITGPEVEWRKLKASLEQKSLRDPELRTLVVNLQAMRDKTDQAASSEKNRKKIEAELGTTTDDLAAKTDGLASATDRANTAVTNLRQKQKDLHDAEEGAATAHQNTVDALKDLTAAQEAAKGNSDEYRQAREDVASAEAGVADAQQQVTDAQQSVLDAQKDLNDARKEAAQRLKDLAQAEKDAALAAQESDLKLLRAKQELERVQARGGSALDLKEAALAVKEAENDKAKAHQDAIDKAKENADAHRAGVEGDKQVVEARDKVTDANKRVADAEQGMADARKRVASAEQAAAKVITDARAKVADAQKKAQDAMLAEADAWENLGAKQGGAVNGLKAYRQALKNIESDLAPGSPLAQRVQSFLADVDRAIELARRVSRRRGDHSGLFGDAGLPTSDGKGGKRSLVSVTQVFQGTPTQQRRAQKAAAEAALDGAMRGGR